MREFHWQDASLETVELTGEKSRASQCVADFVRSMVHAGVESPLNGVTQLANHVAGKELVAELHLVGAPPPAELGTMRWHAQQIGGAIGMIAPFMLLDKGVGQVLRGSGLAAAKTLPMGARLAQAGLSGALYDGMFRPVQSEEGGFWSARLRNAAVGAATFATLSFAPKLTEGWTGPGLRGVTLTAGSLAAGMVNAESNSLLAGKGFATSKELKESTLSFLVAGTVLGVLHKNPELAIERTDTARAQGSLAMPIWLIKDRPQCSIGLPENFRKMHDPSTLADKTLGKGLDDLNASGSAQFTKENLEAVKRDLSSYKLTIVDLRQESHGLINGALPVSWCQGNNQANRSKSFAEITSDEIAHLQELQTAQSATVYKLAEPNKDPNAFKVGVDPLNLDVVSALPESSICKSASVSYVRIPVQDHQAPSPAHVDKFIESTRNLGAKDWLHLHCKAGRGRTTTFLAMYDMMHNANKVDFETIIQRQEKLGGINLLNTGGEPAWKRPNRIERAEFIREFYDYCKEQIPLKLATRFSDWKKAQAKLT